MPVIQSAVVSSEEGMKRISDMTLLVDVDRCVGCYACEIACKQENELPVGSSWCRPISVGPRKMGEELHLDFVPNLCIQCEEPICSYFCSSGAIMKREDGIVFIKKEECTGCGMCVPGCPYGAIYFDDEKHAAGKCCLCASRVDDGLEPSCVQHCLSGALQFVLEEELTKLTRGTHVLRNGKVCYASSKWKLTL